MARREEPQLWQDHEFAKALERLARERVIEASGRLITSEQVRGILNAAPRAEDDRRVFENAAFDGATFDDHVRFDNATFKGKAAFEGATFRGLAGFAGAIFEGDVGFFRATFEDNVGVDNVTFKGDAGFEAAVFKGQASFKDATFERLAWFPGSRFERSVAFTDTTFKGNAGFGEAAFVRPWVKEATLASMYGNLERDADLVGSTFGGEVFFLRTTFEREAWFGGVAFEADAFFAGATFEGDASFTKAAFKADAGFGQAAFECDAGFRETDLKAAFRFGPLLVGANLALDQASFRDVEVRVSARSVTCHRTRFHGPAQLQIRWADIELDDAVFDMPSTLACLPEWDGRKEPHIPCDRPRQADQESAMPCVVSLRRANVSNLTLADIDLSKCLFEGTLRLDQLRLATACPFDAAPSGRSYMPGSFPFVRRWTRRLTIHEERRWRLTTPRWKEWEAEQLDQSSRTATLEIGGEATVPRRTTQPESLAKIYRALRKGREDEKNTPGAADFYYGEMEMRRHAAPVRSAEHLVLWVYWLVCGYGLRASRALAFLAIAVVCGAALLLAFGYREGAPYDPPYDRSYWWSLLLAVESAISLLRAPQVKLTGEGELVEVMLRILGPLFVGLALLSLRGRIQR